MKAKYVFLFVLILLLLQVGCSQKVETLTWQEQYDLGVRYLSEGNYKEAILAFNAAIEIDPRQADAYVGLAEVYIEQGDYEAAEKIIHQGIEACGQLNELTQLGDKVFRMINPADITITEVSFDKTQYCSGLITEFLVVVNYRCSDSKNFRLRISTNANHPQHFRQTHEEIVSGSGKIQVPIYAMPLRWENNNFGILVQLIEDNQTAESIELFEDLVYLDKQGEIVDHNGSIEEINPIPDNFLTRHELRFMGHEADALDIATAKALVIDNGFEAEDGDEKDYYSFIAKRPRTKHNPERPYILVIQSIGEPCVTVLGYHADPWDDESIDIGIRNLYTYEPMESVLEKLCFPHLAETVASIWQIAGTEYSEADDVRKVLSALGIEGDGCRVGFNVITSVSANENGAYVLDDLQMNIMYGEMRVELAFGSTWNDSLGYMTDFTVFL